MKMHRTLRFWATVFLAAGGAGVLTTALANVVATGTLLAECDATGGGLCCGTVAFNNATYDVFGTPVNLGSSVGTISTTDTLVVRALTGSGTFSGTFSSHPDNSLLTFDQGGSFLCSEVNPCVSPVSFVGPIANIAGTVGLPGGATYAQDGTIHWLGSAGAPTTPACPLGQVNVFQGPYAINGFQAVTTLSGANVNNSVSSTFYDSSTGTQVTVTSDITYSNVTTGGETTLTPVSNAAGAIDSRFAVDVASCSVSGTPCNDSNECPLGQTCDGYHAVFFDISTTATFTGPVVVCTHYPDEEPSPPGGDGIVDGTPLEEVKLRILHRPAPGADFEDVTVSRDVIANEICAEVATLSPFVVAAYSPCGNGGGNFSGHPRLMVKKINTDTTAGNDGLLIKGEFTLPNPTSFGSLDPAADGAQVIITNGDSLNEVAIDIPAGAYGGKGTAGWVLNAKGDKWTFMDTTGTPANGIIKIVAKDRANTAPNQVLVQVIGKNGNYPIVSGDQPLQATVVLGGAAAAVAGECGMSNFSAANCAFNAAGNKLTCKQ